MPALAYDPLLRYSLAIRLRLWHIYHDTNINTKIRKETN